MATFRIASLRILVVDDDPLVADSIRRMLEFDGHEVEVAGDAASAVTLFSNQVFDLVMADYEMPKVKGDRLAETLKTMAPDQPVILFTGYAEALSAADRAGKSIDLILGKPFNLAELRDALSRFPRRAN